MRRGRLIGWLFGVSTLGLALSWWNWDRFTSPILLDPLIDQEPRQQPVERAAFEVQANGITYRVQPLYRYELTGLVVSFKRFRKDVGIHQRWNDFINVADVCVVWGSNAREIDLDRFRFWNGEFTCNFHTRDMEAWAAFDQRKISNNHLLSNDPRLQRELKRLQVGDQITLRGWLSEYGEPGRPVRGTSTTREDSGDGACETIYLKDFVILSSMETTWRRLWWPALFGLLAALGLWLITPHQHFRRH